MIKHLTLAAACLFLALTAAADSIPSAFSRRLNWRVGAETTAGFVPGTNAFLKGANSAGKRVNAALSASVRADFSFGADTREGMLYQGLYQGIGLGGSTFFANDMLGTPGMAYIYQGAPLCRFSDRLWLGYEWKFGAAFGWKHYNEETSPDNTCVSTSVTAMMGLGLKLHYALSDRWILSAGLEAVHFSNGNTSWPNAGVNSAGVSLGLACLLTPPRAAQTAPSWLEAEADKGKWMYDIVIYGAWRKRVVCVGDPAERELSPGKYGVAGVQFSPLRRLNRWVAVGPALDLQWDEGAGLAPYWVAGTTGDQMKFMRPPFGKQISAGLSAHAELTMPIFAINAGLGYDFVNPKGNRRFYQSLAIKTFITGSIFLNVGYRLADFKDPENLMLGIGLRL